MESSDKNSQEFVRAANDKNKGALGSLRVQTRHKPSMILPQDNYQVRYKKNGGINTYLDSKLGGYGSKDSTGSIPKKKELTSKN
jgi:hypothetical protein